MPLHRGNSIVVLAFLVTCGAGCSDTEIRVEDDARTCEVGSECVIFAFGDACDACLTDLQPVNGDELDAIRADIDAATATCAPWDARNTAECIIPAPTVRPTCDDGQCVEGTEPCAQEDPLCRGSDA